MKQRRISSALFLLLCFAISCGKREQEPDTPVKKETAADQILRISSSWSSTLIEKSLLSPPSPINVLRVTRQSDVRLEREHAQETLTISEQLELRSGRTVECSTEFEHELHIRFGRKGGHAAVELVRPPLSGTRNCTGSHPQPTISEPTRRALFVLRSDELVAVEPALDERIYRPHSL